MGIRGLVFGTILAALLLTPLVDGGESPRRPNILFLLSDDQRYDTIGALGNSVIRTPRLDRLVEAGTTFTHTYCMGSMNGAVCLPSRSMILSGRSLFRMKPRLEGVVSLPEAFRRGGYETFGTGKWHNGRGSFARAFSDGGAIFFGGMSGHDKVPIYDFDPDGRYAKDRVRPGTGFSSELFADAAVGFLQRHDPEQPFFLYVSFTAPHDPRTPPREYAKLYDPKKIPVPKSFLPEHPFDNGELRIRDEKLAPWPRTPEVVQQHIADYYGMISHLDAQVGRILDALTAGGHQENTIIVFTSDHGLAVGRHGLLGKQNLYEHSTRVALTFSGPGIPRGQQSDALVYLFDIAPTLWDWAGLVAPEAVEGRSLRLAVQGGKGSRKEIFTAYKQQQRALRDHRYKLIDTVVKGVRTVQLYDLAEDPDEVNSREEDPALAEVRARLETRLAELRKSWGDPGAH